MMPARPCEYRAMSESARQTEALGAALGRLLQPGDVICLVGEMGAGKTVFSRGIGAGWGATPPLSSPTYNLAHEHSRRADDSRLYHLDFYRIKGAREAETLGIDELLDGGGIVIFEWPQRALDILPAERLWIDILTRGDDERELRVSAHGERHKALLHELLQALGIGREEKYAAGD